MVRFAHPEFLYGLVLTPFLILMFIRSRFISKQSLKRFGNPAVLQHLMPDTGKYKHGLKFFLLIAAFSLLIVALANPQVGTRLETVKREGVDVLIALDVSNSMKAEDFKPNRLENAKRQISLMLDKLQNDRIGLIVFAGTSYIQLPLTTDYSAARLFLSAIDTDIVPVQGTAIGSAIDLAVKSFVQGEKKHKVIIIISDGENHEDDALDAAKEAAKEGIVFHTIGMGSPQGAPIPVYENGRPGGFRKDNDGNTVITRLDETTLQEIASVSSGKYIRATNRQNELEILFREIESMEKKEFGTKTFTEFEDRFQYPLAITLFFLVLEFFVSERKNRWIDRWKTIFPKAAASWIILLLSTSVSAESERSLVRQGNRQYEQKQFSDAEINYRKALEKKKELHEGQFNLGDSLYKQERYEEAADRFRSFAESNLDPSSRARAYHNLGNSLLKQQKLDDSITAYKEALKLNSKDLDTKYNLEFARQLLKKQQEQKQQKQNENKKDKEQKKQDQKQDQKPDQQNQKDNQQNQQEQKDQETARQDQQQQPEQGQEQKPQQISRQDAERILEALKNEEKNVKKKLLKKAPGRVKVARDW